MSRLNIFTFFFVASSFFLHGQQLPSMEQSYHFEETMREIDVLSSCGKRHVFAESYRFKYLMSLGYDQYWKGKVWGEKGARLKAIEAFEKALLIKNNPDVNYALARALISDGAFGKAIPHLSSIPNDHPAIFSARCKLSYCYIMMANSFVSTSDKSVNSYVNNRLFYRPGAMGEVTAKERADWTEKAWRYYQKNASLKNLLPRQKRSLNYLKAGLLRLSASDKAKAMEEAGDCYISYLHGTNSIKLTEWRAVNHAIQFVARSRPEQVPEVLALECSKIKRWSRMAKVASANGAPRMTSLINSRFAIELLFSAHTNAGYPGKIVFGGERALEVLCSTEDLTNVQDLVKKSVMFSSFTKGAGKAGLKWLSLVSTKHTTSVAGKIRDMKDFSVSIFENDLVRRIPHQTPNLHPVRMEEYQIPPLGLNVSSVKISIEKWTPSQLIELFRFMEVKLSKQAAAVTAVDLSLLDDKYSGAVEISIFARSKPAEKGTVK